MYGELYQITKAEPYMHVICKTLDYVIREMTHPDGGLYSAQDADSEGEEGKFYLWKKNEIESVIDDENVTNIFCEHYGVTQGGNFEGKNILNVRVPIINLAKKYNKTPEKNHRDTQTMLLPSFSQRGRRGSSQEETKRF